MDRYIMVTFKDGSIYVDTIERTYLYSQTGVGEVDKIENIPFIPLISIPAREKRERLVKAGIS